MQIANHHYLGTLRQYFKAVIIQEPTKIKDQSYLTAFLTIKDAIQTNHQANPNQPLSFNSLTLNIQIKSPKIK